jgi:hypothetical protein
MAGVQETKLVTQNQAAAPDRRRCLAFVASSIIGHWFSAP